MANNKKEESKKRILSAYLVVCAISIGAGIISFSVAKNAAKSVLDIDQQSIKIPQISQEPVVFEEKEESNFLPEKRDETEEKLNVNAKSITDVETEKDLTFTSPCEGMLLKRFSKDKPIKSKTMGDFRIHNGIDIKSTLGNGVYAVLDGVVEKIYDDSLLGTTIVIDHGEELKTKYSNMAGDGMVKIGQEIKKGDCIGCVGDTAIGEKLDEAHLHFEVEKDGQFVNPEDFIDIESN